MRHAGAEDGTAGEAFWRFSLALYARPGVADALLALQDRAALDVNLILFALWLGASRGRLLMPGELARAEAASDPIAGAVVAPLRRLRRQLRASVGDPDLAALRRRIASLEIAAERRAQHRLAALAGGASGGPPAGGPLAAALANLTLTLGGEADSAEAAVLRQTLASLIRRAEPSRD